MSTLYFLTPRFGRGEGGVGVSSERIVGILREHHDVVVLVPNRELTRATYSETAAAGLRRIDFAAGQGAESAQFFTDLLLHLFREFPPTAVLGFYAGEQAYAGFLAACLAEVPFDLFVRGNDIDLGIYEPALAQLLVLLARARRIVCVTQELARKVRMLAPESRTVIVPNGTDPVLFPFIEPPEPGPRLRIGMMGEIKAKKGLELLLHALDPGEHELVIVGTLRPESALALQSAVQLKPELLGCVRCEPSCSEIGELLAHIGGFDCLALPSIHDGMANVMLEAMSCGRIVCASGVGGALDVIEHGRNGFLFPSRDTDALSRALKEIRIGLSDEHRRRELSHAARGTILGGFSLDHERERLGALYRER